MDYQTKSTIIELQEAEPQHRIVIIGAGIVGSALAAYISEFSKSQIVLDISLDSLQGSTGHAPGFVGQLNELAPLTQLAKQSVLEYRKIPDGFNTVGGLEIVSTPEGTASIERRYQLAQEQFLPAKILASTEIVKLAPQWHQEDPLRPSKGLYFPSDGTANPSTIIDFYRQTATTQGVVFLEAAAHSLIQENNRITGVHTSAGMLKADCVIVATGVWTARLLKTLGIELPIIPVAHPYVRGPARPARLCSSPFVRWPEQHVYARDHGSFDGFGSYDHVPIALDTEDFDASAIAAWDSRFDVVLDKAMALFPSGLMKTADIKQFNGVFAVTPDGLPLVGPLTQVNGLWVASAVWITQAGGVAKLVADMMDWRAVDETVRRAVDPNRFMGRDTAELRDEALLTYNNIYNKTD
jgi:glycine/D-amino acid oxidase-like deaminating enzyme